MATAYKVLDAVLDPATDLYTVTVQITKDATGNQVFSVKTPKLNASQIQLDALAQVVVWAMSSGLTLTQIKNQTYTVN